MQKSCVQATLLQSIMTYTAETLCFGHMNWESVLTPGHVAEMMFEYLQMAGDLLATSSYPRVPSNGILYELIPTAKSTVQHILLATHRWPSDEC
jgi:hypothetical protein